MSINSAMLAGVSGLRANSSALAALSDNIANANTVGYKRSQADFGSIVTRQGVQGGYSAGGVLATTRQFVTQQGLLQRTGNATDLGVAGQGFFVVTDKPEDLNITDARSFTRSGSFSVDELGYLRNGSGMYLQGWVADGAGAIVTDPSDLSRLQSINVAGVGGTAEPTTRVGINGNLQSNQPLSAELGTYQPDPAVAGYNSMAAYDATTGSGVKPDFEIQIPVSDSQGGKRTVALSLLRSATANEWHAELRVVPASDVETGAGLSDGQIRTGVLRFTQDGRLDLGNSTLFADPANPSLTFGASPTTVPPPALAAGEVRWAADLGVGAQQVELNIAGAASGLSQYASPSVVQSITTNGTPFGNLTSTEVDEAGLVTAVFDNGVQRVIGQVALATFPNPDGLTPISGNAYRLSQESGTHNLKVPGTGGAGFVAPYTLEASTVDLSSEFTGLITTQRAYSASSKIITTADQMLEELLMIKR